jgi:hypothetical protein
MGNSTFYCCYNSGLAAHSECSMVSQKLSKSPTHINESQILPSYTKNASFSNIPHVKSTTLKLEVLNSVLLPNETSFIITPQGVSGRSVLSENGTVFFGYRQPTISVIPNLITLQNSALKAEAEIAGPCFMLRFCSSAQGYYLKDLGRGPGVYSQLLTPLVFLIQPLFDGAVISLGSTLLYFTQTQLENSTQLNIKTLKEKSDCFSFDSANFHQTDIAIGRSHSCAVFLSDDLLSKTHATVFFTATGWNIIDGSRAKHSTNGTWLYLSNEFFLPLQSVFKWGQLLFKASYVI